MATPSPIRARHQHVARQIADAFDVDPEDALNAIRRQYSEVTALFSGEGPGQLFAVYQPRSASGATLGEPGRPPPSSRGELSRVGRRGSDSASGAAGAASSGAHELYFSFGDNLLAGKAVYFLRATDAPVDMDKVSSAWG